MADVIEFVIDEIALVIELVQGIGSICTSCEVQDPEQACATMRSGAARYP